MTQRLRFIVAVGGLALLGWWWLGANNSASISNTTAASMETAVSMPPTGGNSLSTPDAQASATKLPQELIRDHLESAKRDPFAYLAPPIPPAPKKPPPAPAPVIVPPAPIIMAAPAPSAPQHNLRFTGRMTTPDGQQLIFATLADTPVTLAVGQNLANGYRVDSITDRVVQLTYVALGTSARLDLPEPPRYETR
jgi:hypothetical protein